MNDTTSSPRPIMEDGVDLRALAADLDPAFYTAATYDSVLGAVYVRGFDEGFAGTVTWPRQRDRASWVPQLATAYKLGVDAGRHDRRRD